MYYVAESTMEQFGQAIKIFDPSQIAQLKAFIVDREFELGIGQYCTAKTYNIIHKVTGVIAYTGSTIKPLKDRWSGHRSYFKKCPTDAWSGYVADHGGPESFEIVLIKRCPCRTFSELLAIERDCIATYNPVCNIMMRKPSEIELNRDSSANKLDMREHRRERRRQKDQIDAIHFQRKVMKDIPEIFEDRFQKVIENKSSRRSLLNGLAELKVPLVNADYSKEIASAEDLDIIRKICQTIGINHSHDMMTVVAEDIIQQNIQELDSLVKTYQKKRDILPSTARTKQTSLVHILKLNLDTVLKDFAGTKLKGEASRSRKTGRVRRYEYKLMGSDPQVSEIVAAYYNQQK